jgi:uncharacterized protein involved in outer membrane biogenesis
MATRRSLALGVLVIIGAVLAAAGVAARVFLNPDRYRPDLISYIEQNTGKQTEIARLALTLSPKVTIHIYDLVVKSPPPFPTSDVVRMAQADAVIDPWPLLHGAIVIRSLTLKGITITLLSAADGHWNFENPEATGLKNTFPMGIINAVGIQGAQLVVSNLLPSGAVGPAFLEAHDIASDLTVVNLAAIVNPASPSLNGQGTWQAGRLRFGAVETSNVHSTVRLESSKLAITDVRGNAYSGTVAGDFSLGLATKDPSVTADARLKEIDLAAFLAAFHEARASITGTLNADVKLEGEVQHTASPLAGLHGTGHVLVTNGQVPSLLKNSNVGRLAAFNDQGPGKEHPSSFASISADLQLAHLWISSKVVDVDGFGLDVDGSGRVSVSGSDELDYRGVATITTKQGFWTNLFGRLGGATSKDGTLSFPFQIAGTIENPKISKAAKGK